MCLYLSYMTHFRRNVFGPTRFTCFCSHQNMCFCSHRFAKKNAIFQKIRIWSHPSFHDPDLLPPTPSIYLARASYIYFILYTFAILTLKWLYQWISLSIASAIQSWPTYSSRTFQKYLGKTKGIRKAFTSLDLTNFPS